MVPMATLLRGFQDFEENLARLVQGSENEAVEQS